MNRITLHAVGLARCGEWRLLDALEVIARASDEPALAGVLHSPGGLTLLGYSADDIADAAGDCEECEGSGYVDVEGATGSSKEVVCPWCHGDGESNSSATAPRSFGMSSVKVWRTLSGERVEDLTMNDYSRWIDRAAAASIVAEYKRLIAKLAPEANN